MSSDACLKVCAFTGKRRMVHISNRVEVYIEVGAKRTFAAAMDWPGWTRSGRDEAAALQALADYGPRFAPAIAPARRGVPPPPDPQGGLAGIRGGGALGGRAQARSRASRRWAGLGCDRAPPPRGRGGLSRAPGLFIQTRRTCRTAIGTTP